MGILILDFFVSFQNVLDILYTKSHSMAAIVMKFLPPLAKQLVLRMLSFGNIPCKASVFESWIEDTVEGRLKCKECLTLLRKLRVLLTIQTQTTPPETFIGINPPFRQCLLIALSGPECRFLSPKQKLTPTPPLSYLARYSTERWELVFYILLGRFEDIELHSHYQRYARPMNILRIVLLLQSLQLITVIQNNEPITVDDDEINIPSEMTLDEKLGTDKSELKSDEKFSSMIPHVMPKEDSSFTLNSSIYSTNPGAQNRELRVSSKVTSKEEDDDDDDDEDEDDYDNDSSLDDSDEVGLKGAENGNSDDYMPDDDESEGDDFSINERSHSTKAAKKKSKSANPSKNSASSSSSSSSSSSLHSISDSQSPSPSPSPSSVPSSSTNHQSITHSVFDSIEELLFPSLPPPPPLPPPPSIVATNTSIGFRFLLHSTSSQLWRLFIACADTADRRDTASRTEIVSLLTRLIMLPIGKRQSFEVVAPQSGTSEFGVDEKKHISLDAQKDAEDSLRSFQMTPLQFRFLCDLSDLGLIFMFYNDNSMFFTTPLMALLKEDENSTHDVFSELDEGEDEEASQNKSELKMMADASPSSSSSSSSSLPPELFSSSSILHSLTSLMGFIIVEPNARVYAFSSSPFHQRILSLFLDVEYLLPSLLVGSLTRRSVRRAFKADLHAEQIVDYLEQHCHPAAKKQSGSSLPEAVVNQIFIWKKERERFRLAPAVMMEPFLSTHIFESTLQFTQSTNSLLWADANTATIVIKAEARDVVTRHVTELIDLQRLSLIQQQ
ncbi:Transcription initiation factor TFIIH subunit 4 [Monocercomonoides exilis]|uniref:Transcription initiation factor TFIIH subunit 4 n=1 Tax=Monocercomonoides exilis TaxID=2049356 RepID=UPI0035596754|nr:Transcription initiation factor TFIIH subunit 4 [Monocercomonoides exilis]|eukprot:MONOS_2993.1-p1 / transcript=MONOS_2993.1 / gene=MONOS_2993 / organism=Monocercomonoides_exilis_PA203 / gene_product=Transcription initiation factor TFIIH subunit 4 / transcript_product=Transcription initiation factor TFIIH subunit 4 / location=Mono_scaffold00066:65271-68015(-) / protein_length=781 / sequence_SO=supercontig / SO=protein_coding / is_pseudo=false